MFKSLAGGLAALALLAAPIFTQQALAAPSFPPLTGRVVDQANILSPATEQALTDKLAQVEAATHHQLVVATIADLKGDTIEDYGYQLGRAWGIGGKANDDGALLIVAPNEHKVRIEVGYGLEPVLTDALSSVIIQGQILPRFKAGDMEGGVTAGVDAIADQLGLPADQAASVAQQAQVKAATGHRSRGSPFGVIIGLIVFFVFFSSLFGRGRGRGGGLGGALPWLLLGAMSSRGGGLGGGGGGGGWGGGGGGGFSGGGGSFGGGGASGGW